MIYNDYINEMVIDNNILESFNFILDGYNTTCLLTEGNSKISDTINKIKINILNFFDNVIKWFQDIGKNFANFVNNIGDKIFKTIDKIKLNSIINNVEKSNLFVDITHTNLDRFVSDGKTSTAFIKAANLPDWKDILSNIDVEKANVETAKMDDIDLTQYVNTIYNIKTGGAASFANNELYELFYNNFVDATQKIKITKDIATKAFEFYNSGFKKLIADSDAKRRSDLDDIKKIKEDIINMTKDINNVSLDASFAISTFYSNYIMHITNIIKSTKSYYAAYYNALKIENDNNFKIISEIKTNK